MCSYLLILSPDREEIWSYFEPSQDAILAKIAEVTSRVTGTHIKPKVSSHSSNTENKGVNVISIVCLQARMEAIYCSVAN
jgi:hypothetical protein